MFVKEVQKKKSVAAIDVLCVSAFRLFSGGISLEIHITHTPSVCCRFLYICSLNKLIFSCCSVFLLGFKMVFNLFILVGN